MKENQLFRTRLLRHFGGLNRVHLIILDVFGYLRYPWPVVFRGYSMNDIHKPKRESIADQEFRILGMLDQVGGFFCITCYNDPVALIFKTVAKGRLDWRMSHKESVYPEPVPVENQIRLVRIF